MNIVQIAGRVGKKPENRFTPTGQKVTNFSVATSVRKAGKEETVWWRVTVWGDRFDKMISFLDKGSAVIIMGEMNKPEIWTDKEGRPQVTLEITADILKFSPFGNPDKSAQEQTGSSYSQNRSDSSQGSSDSDYSPQNNRATNTSSGYGSNPANSQYTSSFQNEDQLPF